MKQAAAENQQNLMQAKEMKYQQIHGHQKLPSKVSDISEMNSSLE